jgi:hypothetical protein
MDISTLQGLLSAPIQEPTKMYGGLLESKLNNFDMSKYADLTSNNQELKTKFNPLNFDKLLETGALRVTHQANEEGGYNPDPKAGFSLVSAYNDLAGSQSKSWKDNPEAYDIVKNMLVERPADIGAYKYLQIVQSARDLGLEDSDIFLNK